MALYDAIHRRRDVRAQFTGAPVPADTLHRILDAAHAAPGVGYSQPWDSVLVRDPDLRRRCHRHVQAGRATFAATLDGPRRHVRSPAAPNPPAAEGTATPARRSIRSAIGRSTSNSCRVSPTWSGVPSAGRMHAACLPTSCRVTSGDAQNLDGHRPSGVTSAVVAPVGGHRRSARTPRGCRRR
ncbi:nitroreductase family protein [Micromonospora sp. NBC_00421]